MNNYDLVIIGAGPGGYVAAIKAAQLGLKVAIVEAQNLGGTCLNRGCIPTKTLLHTAHLYAQATHAADKGLIVEGAHIDYDALRCRKQKVVSQMRDGVKRLMAANKITVVYGRGRVRDTGCVEVEPLKEADLLAQKEKTSDTVIIPLDTLKLSCKNIIVAAGTVPAMLDIPGTELPGVYTSDSLLACVPALEYPIIIGGGVIGIEFAGLYAEIGAELTVLEAAKQILPPFTREASHSLSRLLREHSCSVTTSAFAQSIEPVLTQGEKNCLQVTYKTASGEKTVSGDGVLIAVGRHADVAGLFDSADAVAMQRNLIHVDTRLHTSMPHVYAIGDISDAGPQLAHAASAQGVVAVCDIAGVPCDIDLSCVPSCVYTSPELACVGLSKDQAKKAGLEVRSEKFSMGANGKNLIEGSGHAYIRITAEAQSGRVVGAELMCARATDIIGEMSVAIACGLTVQQLASAIRPHPTYEEGMAEALEAFAGGSIHALPRSRA